MHNISQELHTGAMLFDYFLLLFSKKAVTPFQKKK